MRCMSTSPEYLNTGSGILGSQPGREHNPTAYAKRLLETRDLPEGRSAFFSHRLLCLPDHGPESVSLHLTTGRSYAQIGSRLLDSAPRPSSTRSSGGASAVFLGGRGSWPCAAERLPANACCTVIDSMPHHPCAHLDIAARRTAGVPCRHGLVQGRAGAPRNRHSSGRRLRHPEAQVKGRIITFVNDEKGRLATDCDGVRLNSGNATHAVQSPA